MIAVFTVSPFSVFAENSSSRDVEQLDFANGLFQRDLYEMASAEYRKLITTFPQSQYLHEAYFGIAEGEFFLKDYAKAIKGYSKYLELFPDGEKLDMVTLRLGQSLFLTGAYSEALLNFSKVSVENLKKEFVQILYFYMGKGYRAKKENKSALQFFEKAAAMAVKNQHTAHAFLEIAEIFAKEKKYSEAIAYYAKVYASADSEKMKGFALYKQGEMQFALKDYVSAIEIFKSVIRKYPKEAVRKEALSNFLLALFNTSKYDDVILTFQNNQDFIQEDKSFFNVFYVTASANFQLNKYIQAVRLLDKMLVFKNLSVSNRQKGFIKKTEVLVKAYRFKDAVDLITKELADAQTNKDQIMFLKAESLYGLGDFSEAYEAYKSVEAQSSDSPFILDALYGAAYAQNARGKFQEALSLFVEYFQKGKDKGKRSEALYNAVLIGKKLGLNQEAIKYCQMYLATFPKNERDGKILFWLGTLYAQEKQYEKAVETLQNFLAKYPESPEKQEVYFLLAYNLQLVDNPEEALAYYGKIDTEKKDANVLYSALKNMVFIYFQQNNDEKAAKVIDKILMEFPSQDLDMKTILWLAQRYLEGKKFEDVLRILKKVQPPENDLTSEEALAYFQARAYKEIQDYPDAIEYYDIVLKTEGDNSYDGLAHIGKGLCLMKIKDVAGARAEFDAAILENTDDNTITMRARFELANIARIRGRLEEAAKFYMLVGVLYTDDDYTPEALFRAGKAFEALGRHQDAQKVFQEIIRDYPESQAAGKIKN